MYKLLGWFLSTPIARAAGTFGLDDAANAAGYKTGNTSTIPTIVGDVLKAIFALLGILFLGMILYAGYNWMTAMGEAEKVTKAKDTLIAAVIGIVIIFAAYAITAFVFSNFNGLAT